MSWSCSSAATAPSCEKLAVLLPYDVKEGFDGVYQKFDKL